MKAHEIIRRYTTASGDTYIVAARVNPTGYVEQLSTSAEANLLGVPVFGGGSHFSGDPEDMALAYERGYLYD